MSKNQRLLIDISWSALLKVVALLVGLWAIYMLLDILVMLFVVFIFVGAVNPAVVYFQRYMSRPLAVSLLYTIFLFLVGFTIYQILPPLINQLNDLSSFLPGAVRDFRDVLANFDSGNAVNILDQAARSLSDSLSNVAGNLFNLTLGFFGGITTLITGLVLSFYLQLEEKNAREFFNQVLPKHRFEVIYTTIERIADRISSWARAELLLMLIIGLANLILFVILGIPSPLPLAILAGFGELVPYVGPFLGLIPVLVVTLISGGIIKALLLLGISLLIIQQLEGNVIVPKIMGKVVGLSPVLVILALLIGSKLYGLLGALIAVPSAAVVSVIVGEWPQIKTLWAKTEKEYGQENGG